LVLVLEKKVEVVLGVVVLVVVVSLKGEAVVAVLVDVPKVEDQGVGRCVIP
jgi:hypothetical protein